MDSTIVRAGFRQALTSFRSCARQRTILSQPRRFLATPSEPPANASNPTLEPLGPILAAPLPTYLGNDSNDALSRIEQGATKGQTPEKDIKRLLPRLRIVPASSSYFTGNPVFTDDLLHLESLARKYQSLPVLPPGEAPRTAWKRQAEYQLTNPETIKKTRYDRIVQVLQRLNYIHPSLMPDEVREAQAKYVREVQPRENRPKPVLVDQWGRARGVGRRKSSHAVAFIVEGEGEVLINGKTLTQAFGRIHDRESAIWALKASNRLDKYNVWAAVTGGGSTGQADALALAIAKALMVHEPALKPALRRAGCVTRDPRRVERKKPGKLKARKMPAWIKR